MNIKNNKKGFTLVELLAVIVVLAIVMSLAVVAITNVLTNTRRSTFVTEAKTFVDTAINLVEADRLNSSLGGSGSSSFAPTCGGERSTVYITLATIKKHLTSGGDTSPYGNSYTLGADRDGADTTNGGGSYVRVVASGGVDNCSMTYSIYLTDGVYRIGTSGEPVVFGEIGVEDVQVVGE